MKAQSKTGRVSGKVALVTGAASGLGRAAARMLTEEGARVILSDLDFDACTKAARETGASADPLRLDVTDEQQWRNALEEVVKTHGKMDVLVNSAGMALIADVENTNFEDWKKVHAVNLDGTFLGCKHAVRMMKLTGGGSIINMSSVSGIIGGFNLAAYNSSKGGVRLFTKSVALHCARRGYNIRCNSIHPTFIDTPMLEGMIAGAPDPVKAKQSLARQVPIGRIGHTEEVGYLVVYLACDESSFVTGAEMVIDGGVTAQ